MGSHVCKYCNPSDSKANRYPMTSSEDVTLMFSTGRSWQMPDTILHYVVDHGWQPPADFIDDVMSRQLLGGHRVQTRTLLIKIGYLSGEFTQGPVPSGFVKKLESLLRQVQPL